MSKLGYFTDNSVQRVRELLTGVHDFTRCERLDGTHYGTAGRCRKGVEVGQENEKRSIQKAFDEGGSVWERGHGGGSFERGSTSYSY
jgi:hypothetical protein